MHTAVIISNLGGNKWTKLVAIYVKSPGFDGRVGKIFVNVFNCLVGYRLASDRKSLVKEAKTHTGLGQAEKDLMALVKGMRKCPLFLKLLRGPRVVFHLTMHCQLALPVLTV